jgi:hypothetical protein
MTTTPPKPNTLVKPTLETKFHIDYSWWERSEEDLHTYLLSHLPPEQREAMSANSNNGAKVDIIDAETGEVFRLDALGLALHSAAKDPEFTRATYLSLVDSIFRVFLLTNNQPMSPNELASITNRPAATILKTLSGGRIYKGIRPLGGS